MFVQLLCERNLLIYCTTESKPRKDSSLSTVNVKFVQCDVSKATETADGGFSDGSVAVWSLRESEVGAL